jgi:hypothetical protein
VDIFETLNRLAVFANDLFCAVRDAARGQRRGA